MAAVKDAGGWPEGLSATVEFPKLPENPTDRQLAQACATALWQLAATLPKMVQGLDFLHGALIGAKGQLSTAMGLAARVDALEKRAPSVPPMREEFSSSHDLREDMKKGVREEFTQLAKRTPGARVESTPNELTDRVLPLFDEFMSRREDAMRIKTDRERLAAIDKAELEAKRDAAEELNKARDEREKFKRKLVYGSILAFCAAAATAAGTYSFGHLAGRSVGASEERDQAYKRETAPRLPAAAPARNTQ